jgi:hypothetical protein
MRHDDNDNSDRNRRSGRIDKATTVFVAVAASSRQRGRTYYYVSLLGAGAASNNSRDRLPRVWFGEFLVWLVVPDLPSRNKLFLLCVRRGAMEFNSILHGKCCSIYVCSTIKIGRETSR